MYTKPGHISVSRPPTCVSCLAGWPRVCLTRVSQKIPCPSRSGPGQHHVISLFWWCPDHHSTSQALWCPWALYYHHSWWQIWRVSVTEEVKLQHVIKSVIPVFPLPIHCAPLHLHTTIGTNQALERQHQDWPVHSMARKFPFSIQK